MNLIVLFGRLYRGFSWLKGHELYCKHLLSAIEQRGLKGSMPDKETLLIDLGDGSVAILARDR